MQDTLTTFLSALQAAHSPPTADALQAAIHLALSAQTSPRPSPPPSSALVLDSEPYRSLLDAPVPSSTSPSKSSSAQTQTRSTTSLAWLRASLAPALVSQALDILKSPSSDADIAESLLELWGYEGIDKVGEAVQRRSEIVSATTLPPPPLLHASAPPPQRPPTSTRDRTPQAQVTFQTSADIAAAKRAKKATQRQQKGKGRDEYDEDGEIDLDDWERIRMESLAVGPVSSMRVRSPSLVFAFFWTEGS
jgi:antiviral helicase SLH1